MLKKIVTFEMVKAVHLIEVPEDFSAAELDDYADLIAEQDSQPIEILDAQIYEVVSVSGNVLN